jgi:formate-dependent nitrite reductase membrane component NrfD
VPEVILTRHNELVDPALHVWGWEIPVYLFLGGLVAGMMMITGFSFAKGRHREPSCVCSVLPWIGLALISAGMFALFLDLEHKWYVWRLYATFQIASPMSWGAWILVFVYPVLMLSALVRLPGAFRIGTVGRAADAIEGAPRAVAATGVASLALGALLGVYTGVLLSALGARPLWSSAALGILFLLSGLSAAAAFVHLVARDVSERERLARADVAFLVLELPVIALFLIGLTTASRAHEDAARLFLGGQFTAVFWVVVVALGMVLPIIMQSLAVRHRIRHHPLMPVLVLVGGLALRFVIVYAGELSRWPMM